jgi:hypothetical protein
MTIEGPMFRSRADSVDWFFPPTGYRGPTAKRFSAALPRPPKGGGWHEAPAPIGQEAQPAAIGRSCEADDAIMGERVRVGRGAWVPRLSSVRTTTAAHPRRRRCAISQPSRAAAGDP